MNHNPVENFVEVRLPDEDAFLKIKETLTRIGIANNKKKTLTQTCHILQKKGKYYIVHFKEMFLLDGKESTFSEEDRLRRNTIIGLLEDWGLLEVVKPEMIDDMCPLRNIKILPYNEKENWELVAKYNIGKKKRRN